MCCEETLQERWFASPIIDLLQRIRRAREMDECNHDEAKGCLLDANWLRVRQLLEHLHENLSGSYSRDVVAVILLKLETEVVVIETLFECMPSHSPRGCLH